jgi:hypothetical protein
MEVQAPGHGPSYERQIERRHGETERLRYTKVLAKRLTGLRQKKAPASFLTGARKEDRPVSLP